MACRFGIARAGGALSWSFVENSTGCLDRRGVSPRPRGDRVTFAGGQLSSRVSSGERSSGSSLPHGRSALGAPPGTRRPAGVRAVTMTHPIPPARGRSAVASGRPAKAVSLRSAGGRCVPTTYPAPPVRTGRRRRAVVRSVLVHGASGAVVGCLSCPSDRASRAGRTGGSAGSRNVRLQTARGPGARTPGPLFGPFTPERNHDP